MAITKEIEIAKIEVVGPYKAVQVATDTVIKILLLKKMVQNYLVADIDTF